MLDINRIHGVMALIIYYMTRHCTPFHSNRFHCITSVDMQLHLIDMLPAEVKPEFHSKSLIWTWTKLKFLVKMSQVAMTSLSTTMCSIAPMSLTAGIVLALCMIGYAGRDAVKGWLGRPCFVVLMWHF